jgi:hypothetical protein
MAIKYAGLRGKEVLVIGKTEAASTKKTLSSDAIVRFAGREEVSILAGSEV